MSEEKTKSPSNSQPNRSKNRPNQRGHQQKNKSSNGPRQKSGQRSGQKSGQRSGQRSRQRSGQKNSRWNRHRISDHFTKRDFDSREKDCSCGSSLRISLGLVGIIEALRAKLNKRIDIVTGYYCPDCRDRQYGIKRDYHHMGVAADIRVTDMPVIDLFLVAETYPEIKGLGINFDNEHVHIDTRKEDERQSWVEINDEWILLTDENRDQYITPAISHDATDTPS